MSDERTGIPGIAIIGMAGRFPRAGSLAELWQNLAAGVDCIRDFADHELPGVSPELLADPDYVKARGVLDGPELFDAGLFDMTPRQAEVTDPQHRLFLECAHEALEDAGYDPERYRGSVGVFGGVSLSTYFLGHILTNPAALQAAGGYQVGLGTDRDYLTTFVSYKLNLRGPSLNVQTACSTSLVAVVLACQSLLAYACDMAIAGGASVKLPQHTGYLYHPGGFDSRDGRCRSFDARADGAVTGAGAGAVLLKRLDEAIEDRDPIRAVILASAFNNDGSARVGFTAPGVEGQAEVIANAQALAGIDPETLTYVECHGSATPLGDPIEVAALTKAFRSNGAQGRGFCAIGSVKSNIGHAAAAAGIAGLIKTTLALENAQIPPSLHFEEPNPKIDFASSPFYVNTELSPWQNGAAPRRAGVSSFGLGGTNAHAILEEAPPREPSGPSRPHQILLLSAASEKALEDATDNLAAHLESSPSPLADIAFTLQVGRRELPHRRMLVCQQGEAPQLLAERHPRRLLAATASSKPPVAFLLPGVGDHYPGMAQGLYETEATFRAVFDQCADLFQPLLGEDLRRLIFTGAREGGSSSSTDLKAMLGRSTPSDSRLASTRHAQPAVFTTEVALAALWAEWGIHPEALLGYSLGEYTAAHLAGIWTLSEAVRIVAERALLLDSLPPGAMLAVPLPPDELKSRAGDLDLDLAAINHHQLGVVAGDREAVLRLAADLHQEGIPTRLLPGELAAHSRALEPAVPGLQRLLASISAKPPRIPLVSNVTGTWLRPEEATDPTYWTRHLTCTVQLARGLATLWENPDRVLLEVGPGFGLSTLALQSVAEGGRERLALPSLPHRDERQPDTAFLLGTLGRLWLAGVSPDWDGFYRHESRQRVRLPTYPFQRERFWIEPGPSPVAMAQGAILEGYEVPKAQEAPPAEPAPRQHARPRLKTAWAPPETPLESRIAGIAGELLGITDIGRHDSFFELGGNSITAAMLVNRLQESLAAELAVAAIFEAPSPAELAALLERDLPEAVAAAFPAADERPRQAAWEPISASRWGPGASAPLSFAQERLWFLDRLGGSSAHYNIPAGLRFTGRLSWPALVGALSGIVERHTALRTTFTEIDGEPRQVIGPPFPLVPVLIDLAALPVERSEPEARRAAAAFCAIPFALATGPLLRGALLRLAADDHAAVFAMHHIVSDGWSVGVFANELTALYGAALEGGADPLPALPVQYADYALWQRRQLSGEALDRRIAFFREALAGVPALELATDRPRPPAQTFRGDSWPLHLPIEIAERLGRLAQEGGASLFMALLAGLAAVLCRWSGQDDFALGTPVAGRHRAQLEGLIGFFVNTLALRVDLAGDPAFSSLLGRVRERTVAAYAHQDVPFEKVVGELRPERDLSRTPLFQVLFVLQNAPAGALDLPDVSLSGFPAGFVAARFDLTWNVTEGPFGLAGALDYNIDLFDRPTAARLAAHWQAALSAVAENPGLVLSELPLLSPAERHQLAREWNDTAAAYAFTPCLPELLSAQAERTPEAVALTFEGADVRYGELEMAAGVLAAYLHTLGVGPEVPVGVAAERSIEMVVALLAVLKAGGAYVPLDPTYPPERLAYMLEDSGVGILLAQGEVAERLPAHRAHVVRLDDPAVFQTGLAPLTVAVEPENAAYAIYTSGSTGRPKGAVNTHRGLLNRILWMQEAFGLTAADVVLQKTPISFDVSVWELFWPLLVGARMVLARPGGHQEPEYLAGLVVEQKVTTVHFVPSILMAFTAAPAEGHALRRIVTSGEALPPALAGWTAEALGTPIHNLYGPTEAAVDVSWQVFEPDRHQHSVPIGRPIANLTLHVLDRHAHPVPLGAPGELHIGGAGLARGYLHRPDLTAERFVPHPAGRGERLYRTGDLARTLPDGTIDYLGRIDHQIKIRGVRIELGEIEAALGRLPEVQAAAALARPDGHGEIRLVGYVVPAPGHDLGDDWGTHLRRALRAWLPEAMIPATFVRLTALPLTPSGKLDRRALPAPGDAERTYVAPRNEIEAALAEIWQGILKVDQVGVHDDFFDLGGHSLLATRVIAAVRDRFGVELQLRNLFEATTVAGAAALIAAQAPQTEQKNEIADLVETLAGLTDEEVEALLAEEGEEAFS